MKADCEAKVVYWHRELPPLDAELMSEHTIDAHSHRVPGKLSNHDAQWNSCYEALMTNAEVRLIQEVARLGGDYAHVFDESIQPRHDGASGQAWLYGRFTYMLYRRPASRPHAEAV